MPIIQGCSKDAVSKNISKLVGEGRSRDQAVAIALETAYSNRKKCSSSRQRELVSNRREAGIR